MAIYPLSLPHGNDGILWPSPNLFSHCSHAELVKWQSESCPMENFFLKSILISRWSPYSRRFKVMHISFLILWNVKKKNWKLGKCEPSNSYWLQTAHCFMVLLLHFTTDFTSWMLLLLTTPVVKHNVSLFDFDIWTWYTSHHSQGQSQLPPQNLLSKVNQFKLRATAEGGMLLIYYIMSSVWVTEKI